MFSILLFFRKKIVGRLHYSKVKAALLFLCILWYSASGYLFFELPQKPDLGWADSLWWTLVTMSTVGYGDLFPSTVAGRYLVGVPTMIFGIGFLGFIISEVASKLIETRSRRLQGMLDVTMKNHVVLVNCTRIEEILGLLQELKADDSTAGKGVCLIDEFLAEIPPVLHDMGVHFVRGNPTDVDVLQRANLQQASHAIILLRDRCDSHADDQNLVTVLVIEKLNPDVFTIVEVMDSRKTRQFELTGADSIVCTSDLTVNLIVQELQDPGVQAIVQDLTSNAGGEQFYLVPIREMREWRYRELVLWALERQMSVIGLDRDGASLLGCRADDEVRPADRAVLIGSRRPREISTVS